MIYFKDEGRLGKRINFGWSGGGWAQIIGVVGAVREMSLAAEAQPTVYAPMAQRGSAICFIHRSIPAFSLETPRGQILSTRTR